MSVTARGPRFNGNAIVDPSINDDEAMGYFTGSVWVNTVTGIAYMCADATAGAAMWTPLRPDIISVYDGLGNQTFTTSPTTINMDVVKKNTNGTIYSISSDVITVSQPGTYLFLYECTLEIASGNSRSESASWLEQNSGAAWEEVQGSRARTYNRMLSEGATTAASGLAFDITAGAQIRLRAQRISGGGTIGTVINGSRLTIMRIL